MDRVSVQRWVVEGFLAAAVTVFALAGFAWNFAQQTLAASSFVAHSHRVMGQVSMLESSLYQAEAAHRAVLVLGDMSQLAERDDSIKRIGESLAELIGLTSDNQSQQRRLAELRPLLNQRIGFFHETVGSAFPQVTPPEAERVARSRPLLKEIERLLQEMLSEERRLLESRSAVEQQRAVLAGVFFLVFMGLLLLVLPAVFWRIRRDFRARWQAERQVAEERRYDDLHARALTLYNSQPTREGVMNGTLSLLAEHPLFPVLVFYAYEEMGGVLRLAASHAAPSDTRATLRLDEGPPGLAARTLAPVYLDRLDAAGELRIETGLASLSPAAVLMSPVSHQGRLLGVLGVAASAKLSERDINFIHRVSAQFALALHNLGQVQELSLLAEQLRVRGEDIQQKNAELERANRMKSEFLANMSHELRTPLNAIIGFSEIMKDGLVGPLTLEQADYIGDIFSSGTHLLSLINDILDLSKVESGHSPLELEPIEPAQLAASGMSVMREKAGANQVRLRMLCPPGQGALRVDVRKAKQIVYNLLANAVKFTGQGGEVTMMMKRVPCSELQTAAGLPHTRVFLPEDMASFAEYLAIHVADTGIGIAPHDLERLFQPFVQIDSSLSRKYAGTGLGLTMVKRLTELHGGGLMLRSEQGRGSDFTVWLPWREVEPEPVVPAVLEPAAVEPGTALPVVDVPPGTAAPLVLLVEDDARAVALMRAQLESSGYRVDSVGSAEEGLVQAAVLRPAALVLDIMLPGMDGWEMLVRLKEREETRHIPVVIVSLTDEARRGFALGASQVLTKPVSMENLLGAIAAVQPAGLAPGGRVLVVDDDPKAITLVSKHLAVAGFESVAAFGGQEALELVQSQAPSLIILDLMMPQVSGFDVLQGLRTRSDTADIPIIVLTAKLLTAEDRLMLNGRVQQVMEKSEFHPASLIAEVRRALSTGRGAGIESHGP